MKEYIQVQEMMQGQNISQSDQDTVKEFLGAFSFTKRQQLMSIFLGFPEKINLFIDLIKKKLEFSKNPTEELSAEILEIEESEIKNLIKELQ